MAKHQARASLYSSSNIENDDDDHHNINQNDGVSSVSSSLRNHHDRRQCLHRHHPLHTAVTPTRSASRRLRPKEYPHHPQARSDNNHHPNPFRARTLAERNANFPSFADAFAQVGEEEDEDGVVVVPRRTDGIHSEEEIGNESEHDREDDVNLSISVQAMVNEHTRQVALHGLDGDDSPPSRRRRGAAKHTVENHRNHHHRNRHEDVALVPSASFADVNYSFSAVSRQSHNTNTNNTGNRGNNHSNTSSPARDPRDVEWERLLDQTDSGTNVSHSFIHFSVSDNNNSSSVASWSSSWGASSVHVMASDDGIEVTALPPFAIPPPAASDDGNHSILSKDDADVSTNVSDYFNTSRALELLRTPDSVRHHHHHHHRPWEPTATRGDAPWSPNDSAVDASVSSTAQLRALLQQRGFSVPLEDDDDDINDNDNNGASPSPGNHSFLAPSEDYSFSLNLSHISADGSLTGTPTLNIGVATPTPLDSSFGVPGASLNQSMCSDLLNTIHEAEHPLDGAMSRTPFSSPPRRPRSSPRPFPNHGPDSSSSSGSNNKNDNTGYGGTPGHASMPWPSPLRPPLIRGRASPPSRASATSRRNSTTQDETAFMEQLALSPISKQAAESAAQFMRASPLRRTQMSQQQQQRLLLPSSSSAFPNPFDESIGSSHGMPSNSRSPPSPSSEVHVSSPLVSSTVEYDTIRPSDDVSLLHSSGSGQHGDRRRCASTVKRVRDSSNPSEEISSLTASPNTSSEQQSAALSQSHPVVQGQCASRTTRSDPSPSPTSVLLEPIKSALVDHDRPRRPRSASASETVRPSFETMDRRRYRSVVPWRVHALNNDDDAIAVADVHSTNSDMDDDNDIRVIAAPTVRSATDGPWATRSCGSH